jgi:hypothetical protein
MGWVDCLLLADNSHSALESIEPTIRWLFNDSYRPKAAINKISAMYWVCIGCKAITLTLDSLIHPPNSTYFAENWCSSCFESKGIGFQSFKPIIHIYFLLKSVPS